MTEPGDEVVSAEMCLPSADLAADLAYFTQTLGFRLDTIYPADDPAVATVSGHGLRLRLHPGSRRRPGGPACGSSAARRRRQATCDCSAARPIRSPEDVAS